MGFGYKKKESLFKIAISSIRRENFRSEMWRKLDFFCWGASHIVLKLIETIDIINDRLI